MKTELTKIISYTKMQVVCGPNKVSGYCYGLS